MRLLAVAVLACGFEGCSYFFPSCQTIPPCPAGQVLCTNASCADLNNDPLNCGACEHVCAAGLSCVPSGNDAGGSCGCLAGTQLVDGACIDVSRDVRNCGGVGIVCAAGQVCVDGRCGCAGEDAGAVAACPIDGGMVCANLSTDDANCGACGRACAAAAACQSGHCFCDDGNAQCGAACCATACVDGGCAPAGDAGHGGPDAGA
jgi:hypothetical protein